MASRTIMAFTLYKPNYMQLLEHNLMLPIVSGQLNPEHYLPNFELGWLQNTLCDVGFVKYYLYFHKDRKLRIEYFDIIRAMGLKDIWVMDEMLTYGLDDSFTSIYEFIDHLQKDDPKSVNEFNTYDFNYDEDGYCTNIYGAYHDNFQELFENVEKIEQQFNVHVLGSKTFGDGFIRVVPNGEYNVMFLNTTTSELVLKLPTQ